MRNILASAVLAAALLAPAAAHAVAPAKVGTNVYLEIENRAGPDDSVLSRWKTGIGTLVNLTVGHLYAIDFRVAYEGEGPHHAADSADGRGIGFNWGTALTGGNFADPVGSLTRASQYFASNVLQFVATATTQTFILGGYATDTCLTRGRHGGCSKTFERELEIGKVELKDLGPSRVNVPGPVAGAGLPFLIAGAALYMRRRNARA